MIFRRVLWCAVLSFIISAALSVSIFAANTPYNISVTFNNDTKTEMNITWMTPERSDQNIIEIWQDGSQPTVFKAATKTIISRNKYYKEEAETDNPTNIVILYVNSVTVTGLKPNKTYSYRCGDGSAESWSENGKFITGMDSGDYQFLFMTDMQAYTDASFEAWRNTGLLAMKRFPNARFCMLGGDLVDIGGSEWLWNRFFSYGKKLMSNMTMVPAIGNHETDYGAHTFDSHFLFPKNKESMPDYVYSFNYGDVHVSVLSTEMTPYNVINNELLNRQTEWLKRDVRSSNKKWNVVLLHKALYSPNYYLFEEDITGIRERLIPVFDELSIDAVFQGHEHVFSRTFIYRNKIVGGMSKDVQSVTKDRGTLYILGNTAAQKFSGIDDQLDYLNLLKYGQPNKPMYIGVTVNDKYLKFDTFVVNNSTEDELYDTFTVYKSK